MKRLALGCCRSPQVLFISFTILINFILLNVIIGIICVNFELQVTAATFCSETCTFLC